ncbi:MAG: hypothetical protein ACXW1Z_25090 [Methylobacter sp.]
MHKYRFLKGHPFFQERSNRYEKYLDGLNSVIDIIANCKPITAAQTYKSITDKLQVNKACTIDKNQYLQYACELTVAAYLCRVIGGSGYEYEYVVHGDKDIDSSFEYLGVRINLEVKCPNPKPEGASPSNNSLVLRTHGKIDNFVQMRDQIGLLANIGNFASYVSVRNSDYNIRDALVYSSMKFLPEPQDDELNCVVICGDGGDSLQHYYHCLYGAKGLLTVDSWHNYHQYENIDAIILSNVRHRHDKYLKSTNLTNPWQFEDAFNLVLENPLRIRRLPEKLTKLLSAVHNYNSAFNYYVAPGEAPADVLEGIKLAYFVQTEMPRLDEGCF